MSGSRISFVTAALRNLSSLRPCSKSMRYHSSNFLGPNLRCLSFWPSMAVPSMPSSPYKNWMTSPIEFLMVPSYLSMMSSMALMSLLWMYPVLAVLIAVSIRPSLPPMAWKKNSCGVRPLRYEFSTNPRLSGPWSSLVKWGRVLLTNPNGIRFPSTFCCPTHAVIWEMLMKEPLLPPVTMTLTLFRSEMLAWAFLPARSLALFSEAFTLASKVSTSVLPGWGSSFPFCASSIRSCTSLLAREMMLLISSMVASSATVSPMPTVKPCCSSQ